MHKTIILSILSVCLIACPAVDPCQNKDLFIKKHKSFVEETLEHYDTYTDDEWEARDAEFDELINDCYTAIEEDMSTDEKKKFWIANSEYLSHRVKEKSADGIEALTGLIESFAGNSADIAEGLTETFGEDLKETLENFEDDLKDVFDEDFKAKLEELFNDEFKDDLKKTFEDLGEKLKEMGEELKDITDEKQ